MTAPANRGFAVPEVRGAVLDVAILLFGDGGGLVTVGEDEGGERGEPRRYVGVRQGGKWVRLRRRDTWREALEAFTVDSGGYG